MLLSIFDDSIPLESGNLECPFLEVEDWKTQPRTRRNQKRAIHIGRPHRRGRGGQPKADKSGRGGGEGGSEAKCGRPQNRKFSQIV